MQRVLLSLVFCTLIGFSGLAFACGGSHSSSHSGYHGKSKHHSLEDKFFDKYKFFMRNSEALSLNNDQVQAIKDIKMAVKKARVEAEAAIKLAMLDVWAEMHKEDASLETINASIDLKMDAKQTLYKVYAKAILDAKAVLNPEQYANAKKIWHEEKYAEKD